MTTLTLTGAAKPAGVALKGDAAFTCLHYSCKPFEGRRRIGTLHYSSRQ